MGHRDSAADACRGMTRFGRCAVAVLAAVGAGVATLLAPPLTGAVSASADVGVPTNVTALARNGAAIVSWTPPATDIGQEVSAYRAVVYPGGHACEAQVGVDENPLTCTITGLTNGVKYQVMVAARSSAGGWGAYAPDDRFALGDFGHAGGRIMYDAGSMQTWGRYLEVAPVGWDGRGLLDPLRFGYCNRTQLLGAAEMGFGAGAANTARILEKCPWSGFKAVADYNGGHRNDWFVPSLEEMTAIWRNRSSADLSNCDHWTSSERTASTAWTIRVSAWGSPGELAKSWGGCVRPVRYVDGYYTAVFVTPNDGLPDVISDLRVADGSWGRGYDFVRLQWTVPEAHDNPVIGHRVRISSNGGNTWDTLPAGDGEGSYLLDDLPYASAHLVMVAAVTEFGRGPWSPPLLVTTRGANAKEIWVVDGWMNPVRGGSITWEMVPRTAWSAVPYGLDSAGEIVFPSAPAGTVRITLTDGVLTDGSLVSGQWVTTLGFGLKLLSVGARPSPLRTVAVSLPGELPVSNASVTVNGLTDTYRSGDFTFTMPGFASSGRTDAAGTFTARGFPAGPVTAEVVYDDGVIGQQQTIPFAGTVAFVELEYAPYVEPVEDEVTVEEGEAVEVVLEARLAAPRDGRALRERYAAGRAQVQSGVRVTLVPPRGAARGSCGAQLTGVTDARGRVRLTVCATKSGEYRVRSAGAMPVGGYTMLVLGAPALPPKSVSAWSPRIGVATLSWERPDFTGGATVSAYRLTLTAPGKATLTRTVPWKPGRSLSTSFRGLAHATTYQVSVRAVTKHGVSDPFVTSVPVA